MKDLLSLMILLPGMCSHTAHADLQPGEAAPLFATQASLFEPAENVHRALQAETALAARHAPGKSSQ